VAQSAKTGSDNLAAFQLTTFTSTQTGGLTPAQLNAVSTASLDALNFDDLSTAQGFGAHHDDDRQLDDDPRQCADDGTGAGLVGRPDRRVRRSDWLNLNTRWLKGVRVRRCAHEARAGQAIGRGFLNPVLIERLSNQYQRARRFTALQV
jgi:hypothetical protein